MARTVLHDWGLREEVFQLLDDDLELESMTAQYAEATRMRSPAQIGDREHHPTTTSRPSPGIVTGRSPAARCRQSGLRMRMDVGS